MSNKKLLLIVAGRAAVDAQTDCTGSDAPRANSYRQSCRPVTQRRLVSQNLSISMLIMSTMSFF
jgi:hypothetical protein